MQFPVKDYNCILETIAKKMGYKLPGDEPNIKKTEDLLLRSFTEGGKMTLDTPIDFQAQKILL